MALGVGADTRDLVPPNSVAAVHDNLVARPWLKTVDKISSAIAHQGRGAQSQSCLISGITIRGSGRRKGRAPMRTTSIEPDDGFVGFNVFKRPSDPELLSAVKLVSSLPIILDNGWAFSHFIEKRKSLPARFDMAAAEGAIQRHGYYIFDSEFVRRTV